MNKPVFTVLEGKGLLRTKSFVSGLKKHVNKSAKTTKARAIHQHNLSKRFRGHPPEKFTQNRNKVDDIIA